MNISISLIKYLHYPNPAILTFVNVAVSALMLISKQPIPSPPPLSTLNLTTVITRLSYWIGIHGSVLNWFKCYLSSRSFRVKSNASLRRIPVCVLQLISQVRRGRPGGLVQLDDGFLPSWLSTIKSKALFAGTSGSRRATWPKRDRRRLRRISLIVGRPVFWSTSALVIWSHQWMLSICRWHFIWNAPIACLCRQPEVSRFQLRRAGQTSLVLDTDVLWCSCWDSCISISAVENSSPNWQARPCEAYLVGSNHLSSVCCRDRWTPLHLLQVPHPKRV